MTLTYPYSLAWLSDILPISAVTWSIKRNDTLSGQGYGRIWQTEMAPPLWVADIELDDATFTRDAKRYAARIRALHGAQEAFFLCDPISPWPAADWRGASIAGYTPSILLAGADRSSLALAGLPAGYKLTEGDKFSLSYFVAPQRFGFFEVSEPVVANGLGETPLFSVFPHLPEGPAAGMAVTLVKAACRMIIEPDSHNPGRARRTLTEGARFRVIQKI